MTARPLPNGLVLAYYGDDFTGSTDVMEALTLNGLPTLLFLTPPTAQQLADLGPYRAVGIAGVSRSRAPTWMDDALPAVFAALRDTGAPLIHYKTCSTFDSAPAIGSVGRAIDIGQRVCGSPWVPLVVGAPVLRRYTVFGNLFATVDGETHRLDRHPTMAHHPVTPMTEADLRRHLALQTNKSVALVDVLALAADDVDRRVDATLAGRPDVVLFDVLDEASLAEVGRQIWRRAEASQLIAGSSGVEYALVAHWHAAGDLPTPEPLPAAAPADRLAVVSGSCSPVTARQIEWALANGFGGVRLDPGRLAATETAAAACAEALAAAQSHMSEGRNVVAYTATGPDDPSIAAFDGALSALGLDKGEGGARVGEALGRLLRDVLTETRTRRAVIAGGDTAGYGCQAMGLSAVTMVTPIAPGSPLCRAVAPAPALDGLEIALKGGQVGGPDYFGAVRRGAA